MDLSIIGKFIAELRKEHGLTQEELGARLCVTNKTVSRWETGTYLPPADILLKLSDMFNVSINEILSGKRLSDDEYKNAAESNLVQSIKSSSFELHDRIHFFKHKWLHDHIVILIVLALIIFGFLVYGIFAHKLFCVYASFFLFIFAHIWRYNKMMSYVEYHVYGNA